LAKQQIYSIGDILLPTSVGGRVIENETRYSSMVWIEKDKFIKKVVEHAMKLLHQNEKKDGSSSESYLHVIWQ